MTPSDFARSVAASVALAAGAAAGQASPQKCSAAAPFQDCTGEGVRGDAPAVAAAERLLTAVGGREAWNKGRTFYVEERLFLRSGEVAELRIWRDLETGSRRLERRTRTSSFLEWLAPNGGFEVRDGVFRRLPSEELAIELQGLMQEPYSIYRRLARNDRSLRAELRDGNALYIYGRGEQLLCWFHLNDAGAPVSWANLYNGSINQHFYGPLFDAGDTNQPRWGASPTGLRLEYLAAKFLPEAATPPTP